MFRWRKDKAVKSKQPKLYLYDGNMQVLFYGELSTFPLPENVILACSEEFFGDPSPCEIHRRAVQLRLYGEMMEALPMGKTLSAQDFPPCISLYCHEMYPKFIRLDMAIE